MLRAKVIAKAFKVLTRISKGQKRINSIKIRPESSCDANLTENCIFVTEESNNLTIAKHFDLIKIKNFVKLTNGKSIDLK